MTRFHSCCSCVSQKYTATSTVINDAPDPNNFKITNVERIGSFTILKVNYPNCKNYKGDKVMVFDNLSELDLVNLKTLDPHFTDMKLSPIARFKPDKGGWGMAISFCQNVNTK